MPVTRCYQMLQLCIAKSTLKVIIVLHLLETRTEELICKKVRNIQAGAISVTRFIPYYYHYYSDMYLVLYKWVQIVQVCYAYQLIVLIAQAPDSLNVTQHKKNFSFYCALLLHHCWASHHLTCLHGQFGWWTWEVCAVPALVWESLTRAENKFASNFLSLKIHP